MTYGVKLHVWGERACFTRPEMKAERVSYDILTPSAARGVLESIHWKPAIRWVVDSIHVLKPIRFQSIRRNEVKSKISFNNVKKAMTSGTIHQLPIRADDLKKHREQRATTLLTNVAYVVEAHFEMTDKAGPEDNPAKHYEMFTRRARDGQCFQQPYLGCREFPASFELVGDTLPKSELPETPEPRDLGWVLLDIDHADDRTPRFFRAVMENGVVRVPPMTGAGVRS
jgi:CRISPR-associated protein Cas5d